MIFIADQVYIFLYAIVGGAIAAFFYDFLRIKRRTIKTNAVIVAFEDILYWLAAAVFLFVTVYISNGGEMRGFIFIGNIIGVLLYESIFSNIIIASSVMIINILKRLLLFIFKVLSYPFIMLYKVIKAGMTLLYKVIRFIFKPICNIMNFIYKKIYGLLEKPINLISGKVLGIFKEFFDKVKRLSGKASCAAEKKLKKTSGFKKNKKEQKNN
ncbi:spore cortex biosynthesis protein YabQ [Ruminiclostridium sufflavum DSM 19573]|uniref:Spore cortex biosynthesis protein YabQ n=1 Tax=Ruminiclostridium sufflavum DSM 19573 TaxID=1121337 RepID=A0A318XN47_9FIRM|nr:spore cortex biosynthesis protein YabQ [Ruminiclostridium sufflavum]PYG88259.1 spore cortex biosynthesis protein YabQ [Ruminiclostridium sufflavum DSM 19573]